MRISENVVFGRKENLTHLSMESASLKGVALKTTLLLAVTLFAMTLGIRFLSYRNSISFILYFILWIVNIVLQVMICHEPTRAKYLAIPYVIFEGLSLGTLCSIIEFVVDSTVEDASYGFGLSITSLALVITVSIFFSCVLLYGLGIVKPNQKMKSVLLSLVFGIIIATVIMMLLSLIFTLTGGSAFNFTRFFDLYFGIGLIVAIISAIVAVGYVTLTIDQAKQMVDRGLDKDYEWYASFGIALNVIWLFIEILRVLYYVAILFGGSSRRK
jgi:uncharacterized YccA/Bax inhibitor family protein